MPKIHPSSYIDEQVELADDVEIGPFCVIEGSVKIGPGCRLLHRVSLQGPLIIGEGNTFYPNVCIGFAGQDLKYDPAIPGAGTIIGDNNMFREGVSIHRATKDKPTTIGSRNYFMAYCHAGHDAQIGNECLLSNSFLLAGHTILEDRVIGGGSGALHQFCRIGRLSMIGGVVAVAQDVPPFCLVARTRRVSGLNVVGLRRAGLRDHIKPLHEAYRLFFLAQHTRPHALELIREKLGDDPLCIEFADFIDKSVRGITNALSRDEFQQRD